MSSSSRQLPRDARLVALLIASMGVDDADPGVIAMLMEFAHRWASDILSDALVYAEHAHRQPQSTAPEMDDIKLAIQARLEQTMSNPWPREFLLSMASSLNRNPLPPIPESYGIRLPPERERLTAVNFNLVPKSSRIHDSTQDVADDAMEGVQEEDLDENEDADNDEDDDLFGDEDLEEEPIDTNGALAGTNGSRPVDADEDYDD